MDACDSPGIHYTFTDASVNKLGPKRAADILKVQVTSSSYQFMLLLEARFIREKLRPVTIFSRTFVHTEKNKLNYKIAFLFPKNSFKLYKKCLHYPKNIQCGKSLFAQCV